MNSRANKTLGRSMIPNYAIADVPSEHKKKSKKKKKSDYPSFGSDQYKESMEVVDKSKHYDKQVRYLIVAIIGMLIILALAPLCIVILKKWRWRWLASVFDVRYVEDEPGPSVVGGNVAYSSAGNTTYIPVSHQVYPPVCMSAYPSQSGIARSQLPVNPTGEGIDINKPYVIPSSALKTFTSTEL